VTIVSIGKIFGPDQVLRYKLGSMQIVIIVGGKIFGPDQVLHYVKGCYPGWEGACVHVLGSGSENLDKYLLSEIVKQGLETRGFWWNQEWFFSCFRLDVLEHSEQES